MESLLTVFSKNRISKSRSALGMFLTLLTLNLVLFSVLNYPDSIIANTVETRQVTNTTRKVNVDRWKILSNTGLTQTSRTGSRFDNSTSNISAVSNMTIEKIENTALTSRPQELRSTLNSSISVKTTNIMIAVKNVAETTIPTVTTVTKTKYAFIVRTSAKNVEVREEIRKQWQKSNVTTKRQTKDCVLSFAVESVESVAMKSEVEQEIKTHKDVILAPAAVLKTIKYLHTLESLFLQIKAEFYVISLDDTFVNFDSVVQYLDKSGLKNSVYGAVSDNPSGASQATDLHREIHPSFYIISGDAMPTILKGPGELAHAAEWFFVKKIRTVMVQRIVTKDVKMGEMIPTPVELFTGKLFSLAQVTLEYRLKLEEYYGKVTEDTSLFWGYFTPRKTKQWSAQYDVRIDSASCEPGVEMVIMVHSSTQAVKMRMTTRKTWASPAHGGKLPYPGYTLRTKLLFVTGKSDESFNEALRLEAKTYGDIIQGSFGEHYFNLTEKQMFALNWIYNHCRDVKYVIKADDDIVVNMAFLQHILNISELKRTFIGETTAWHMGGRWPHVAVVKQWDVSKEYPFKLYPYFSAGSMYLLTADLLKDLVETVEYVPYLHCDDVFVSGFLALAVGVNHVYWPQWRHEPTYTHSASYLASGILQKHWVHTYFTDKRGHAEDVWKELENKR